MEPFASTPWSVHAQRCSSPCAHIAHSGMLHALNACFVSLGFGAGEGRGSSTETWGTLWRAPGSCGVPVGVCLIGHCFLWHPFPLSHPLNGDK